MGKYDYLRRVGLEAKGERFQLSPYTLRYYYIDLNIDYEFFNFKELIFLVSIKDLIFLESQASKIQDVCAPCTID